MFRKLQTRFSRNNVFALGAHYFSKSLQPIIFKFSTFTLNINIYGVTKAIFKIFNFIIVKLIKKEQKKSIFEHFCLNRQHFVIL